MSFPFSQAMKKALKPLVWARTYLFRGSSSFVYESRVGGRKRGREAILAMEGNCWINNGYWRGPATFREAQRDLAQMVGETAGLGPGDRLLDVGFGYAEQVLLWSRAFGVANIVGVDISRLHVDVGQERVKRAGLNHKIQLIHGSAVKLNFEPGTFDKVIALESALHFNTREQFFSEAHRMLHPGGVLVLADMIPAPGQQPLTLKQRYGMRQHYIPVANMYDRHVYAEKLRVAGFEDVVVSSIANQVYDVSYKFLQWRNQDQKDGTVADLEGTSFEFTEQDRGKGIAFWEKRIGTADYVIAKATKPRT